jgi:hypothetical protein
MYRRQLVNTAAREGMTTKSLTTMTPYIQRNDIKVRVDVAAKESTCGEYLTYLFLLLANNRRFATPKTNLNNNFLVEKQEYPTDVLSAKRPMTN